MADRPDQTKEPNPDMIDMNDEQKVAYHDPLFTLLDVYQGTSTGRGVAGSMAHRVAPYGSKTRARQSGKDWGTLGALPGAIAGTLGGDLLARKALEHSGASPTMKAGLGALGGFAGALVGGSLGGGLVGGGVGLAHRVMAPPHVRRMNEQHKAHYDSHEDDEHKFANESLHNILSISAIAGGASLGRQAAEVRAKKKSPADINRVRDSAVIPGYAAGAVGALAGMALADAFAKPRTAKMIKKVTGQDPSKFVEYGVPMVGSVLGGVAAGALAGEGVGALDDLKEKRRVKKRVVELRKKFPDAKITLERDEWGWHSRIKRSPEKDENEAKKVASELLNEMHGMARQVPKIDNASSRLEDAESWWEDNEVGSKVRRTLPYVDDALLAGSRLIKRATLAEAVDEVLEEQSRTELAEALAIEKEQRKQEARMQGALTNQPGLPPGQDLPAMGEGLNEGPETYSPESAGYGG